MDNENVVQATPAAAAKKPNQIIRYAILGVIGLVALALVISIIGALVPDKFALRDDNSLTYALNDDDQMVFLFNGKKMVEVSDEITDEIYGYSYDSGDRYYSISIDYNYEYAVFATEGAENEDGEYSAGDLYVVNSKKVQKAAEEVSYYNLSAFGDTFLYISDGDLYYGELKNPTKAKKVDSDVDQIAAVSPDGESFAYLKVDDEGEELEYDYYISKNGKKGEKFEKKDSEISMISNGAKYVYYTKDAKLYVNDTKLADVESLTGTVLMNRDGSQMIYSAKNDEGESKIYLVSKAGDKVTVGSGVANSALAPNGAVGYSAGYVYNTSSLAKCAISAEDEGDSVYYYLKNLKGNAEKISSLKNASTITMLDDAKTVIYLKSGNLRSMNITKPNSEPTEYTGSDEDIASFSCTTDGEHIYVRDTDSTLYYVKSTSKMKKIKDDVTRFVTTENGKVYFINDDEDLYVANKSDNAKKVTSEVDSISYNRLADVIVVEADGEFGTVSGKKFKKLFPLK